MVLRCHSFSHRLRIYEVGDISDADAVAFVIARYQRSAEFASELVATIAGGRFPLLQAYGKSVRPLAVIRAELEDRALASLKGAGVSPTHPLFRALLTSGALRESAVLEFLPKAKVAELLCLNILAVHPTGMYTVNNRLVTFLIRSRSRWWGA